MHRDIIDADPALAALRLEASSGLPDALYRLAGALVLREQLDEAFGLCRLAAAAGHADAQVEHARMLLHGLGTDPDPGMAVEWLLRAEGIGNPVAGYYLALIALGNVALPRDGRINQRLLAAAHHDYPPALRALAILYGQGHSADDQSTCIKLLDRGTDRGDVIAAQLLAERLRYGEGCEPQPDAADELWSKLVEHGVPALPVIRIPAPAHDACSHPAASDGSAQPEPGASALEDLLKPAPWALLSTHPRVMQIDHLLSADECRLLIACAQLHQRNATPTPVAEDVSLQLTQLRMARSARSELGHAEHLVMHWQPPGPAQRPRHGYLTTDALALDRPWSGNRRRTIRVHLNDVEAGGETEFPAVPLRIAPQAGRAVVFDHYTADGMPDAASVHGALSVRRGESWLAELSFRQRVYRSF